MAVFGQSILCITFLLVGITSGQDLDFVESVSQNYNERVNSRLEQHVLGYNIQELAYKAYATYFGRADVDLPGFRKFFQDLEKKAKENSDNMTTLINMRGGRIRFPSVRMSKACDFITESLTQLRVTLATPSPTVTVAPRTKADICYFQNLNPDPFVAKKKKRKGKGKKAKYFDRFYNYFKAKPGQESADRKRKDWPSGLYGLEDALAMEKSVNEDLLFLIKIANKFKDPHIKHNLEEYMDDQVARIKKVADLLTKLRQYKLDEDYPLGEYLLDKEMDS